LNQSRRTNHAKEMFLVEEFGTYIPKYFKTFLKIYVFGGLVIFLHKSFALSIA
jgi:hypothetical protein